MDASTVFIFTSCLLASPVVVFMGARDGVIDVLEIPPNRQTDANINLLTVILLTILTVTAMFVTDLGLINAVGGGTLATMIVFVFPGRHNAIVRVA